MNSMTSLNSLTTLRSISGTQVYCMIMIFTQLSTKPTMMVLIRLWVISCLITLMMKHSTSMPSLVVKRSLNTWRVLSVLSVLVQLATNMFIPKVGWPSLMHGKSLVALCWHPRRAWTVLPTLFVTRRQVAYASFTQLKLSAWICSQTIGLTLECLQISVTSPWVTLWL